MGEIKQVNIKNRTYYFYNDIIHIKNFDAGLLKIEKNIVFTILDILQLKKFMIVKIFTVYILCIYLLIMQMDILKKKGMNKYLVFDSTDENKELLKNIMMFLLELVIKSKK